MNIRRRTATAAVVGLTLVVVAFAVPPLHLGIVTPLINSTPERLRAFADTAPIFGWWNAHVGWGTVPRVAVGVGLVGVSVTMVALSQIGVIAKPL